MDRGAQNVYLWFGETWGQGYLVGMWNLPSPPAHCYPTEGDWNSLKINSSFASSFCFFAFRRRREKLQAHLKESRSLKNYSANSHNAQDVKMRAPNINLRMHEVTIAGFTFCSFTFSQCCCLHVKDINTLSHQGAPTLFLSSICVERNTTDYKQCAVNYHYFKIFCCLDFAGVNKHWKSDLWEQSPWRDITNPTYAVPERASIIKSITPLPFVAAQGSVSVPICTWPPASGSQVFVGAVARRFGDDVVRHPLSALFHHTSPRCASWCNCHGRHYLNMNVSQIPVLHHLREVYVPLYL